MPFSVDDSTVVVDVESDGLTLVVGVRVGEGVMPGSGHNGKPKRTSNGNQYAKLFLKVNSIVNQSNSCLLYPFHQLLSDLVR